MSCWNKMAFQYILKMLTNLDKVIKKRRFVNQFSFIYVPI